MHLYVILVHLFVLLLFVENFCLLNTSVHNTFNALALQLYNFSSRPRRNCFVKSYIQIRSINVEKITVMHTHIPQNIYLLITEAPFFAVA